MSNFGYRHPEFRWVDSFNGKIPEDAIQGGMELDGQPLYIARAVHNFSLVPGKAAGYLEGISFSYGDYEIRRKKCQILCGDPNKLIWKECRGKLKVQGWTPLQCGYEAEGEGLFIAKAIIGGKEVLGKVGEHFKPGMAYAFEGNEYYVKLGDVYHVLSVPNS